MKKHYLKKLIFLLSVSLLSSLSLGCAREIPMPIVGDVNTSNPDENTINKNSETTKTNAKTINKISGIKTSKEKKNNFNDTKETSSAKNESTTESDTPKQINIEETSNNTEENTASSNSRALRTNDESSNTIFNIKIHNNNLSENKIGYIYNISYSNNTYYIEFDDVEMFLGKDAEKEFLADGNSEEAQDIESGYYIKNSNNNLKKYILTENCTYELCKYQIDSSNNDIDLVSVDFETIKNYILKYQEFYPTRALLFDISIENNTVTKISMHFTP